MTLFKTPLAAAPPAPAALKSPNWSTDQGRLTKLKTVIADLIANDFGAKIETNVLLKGSTTDNIKVIGTTTLSLHIPSDATKQLISLFYFTEFTNIFAIDYLDDVIKKGILGTVDPDPESIYNQLKDQFVKPRAGFNSIADLHEILTINNTSNINDKLTLIRDKITSGAYINPALTGRDNFEKAAKIYQEIMLLVNTHVLHESRCLFSYLLKGFTPPDVDYMAVGDGATNTAGLYNEVNRGLLFFRYKMTSNNNKANFTQVKSYNRIGNGFDTKVHLSFYGLDEINPIKKMTIEIEDAGDKVLLEIQHQTPPALPILRQATIGAMSGKFSFDPATYTITILNRNPGTFKITTTAAELGISNYDEAVLGVYIVQDRQRHLPFELDAENQYGSNEFVLKESVKKNTNGTWKIWNDPVTVSYLDFMIDDLVANPNKIVKSKLVGRDIGKRAFAYSTSKNYTKGEMIYNSTLGVYESAKDNPGSFSVSNPNSNPNWSLKYPIYNPSATYNLSDLMVIGFVNNGTALYHLYKANEAGITGPFDAFKWIQLSVVEPETNRLLFDTAGELAHYPFLKYSFADVTVTDNEITFNIDSFVSPQLARLDRAFLEQGGKTIAQVNIFNQKFTTSKGVNTQQEVVSGSDVDPLLNTYPKVPIYNIPLSFLRSMGLFEALKERILSRVTERSISNPQLTARINGSYSNPANKGQGFEGASLAIPLVQKAAPGVRVGSIAEIGRFGFPEWTTYKWQP